MIRLISQTEFNGGSVCQMPRDVDVDALYCITRCKYCHWQQLKRSRRPRLHGKCDSDSGKHLSFLLLPCFIARLAEEVRRVRGLFVETSAGSSTRPVQADPWSPQGVVVWLLKDDVQNLPSARGNLSRELTTSPKTKPRAGRLPAGQTLHARMGLFPRFDNDPRNKYVTTNLNAGLFRRQYFRLWNATRSGLAWFACSGCMVPVSQEQNITGVIIWTSPAAICQNTPYGTRQPTTNERWNHKSRVKLN